MNTLMMSSCKVYTQAKEVKKTEKKLEITRVETQKKMSHDSVVTASLVVK